MSQTNYSYFFSSTPINDALEDVGSQASSPSLLPVTDEERLETISEFSLPSVTTGEGLESISQLSLPSVTTGEVLESISQLSLPSVTTFSQSSDISRLHLSDTSSVMSSVMSTRSTTSRTTSRFRRFSIPEKTSLLEICGKSQETNGGRLKMSEIVSSWLTKHPDVQITPDQLRNKVKKMTPAIKALKNVH